MAVLAVVAVLAAVIAVGAIAAQTDRPAADDRAAGPTTRDPSPTRAPMTVPMTGTDGGPPPIVVRGDGPQVEAWQGSYCWGNRCADMIVPRWRDLPQLGSAPTVEAGFADPDATWTATLSGHRRCARFYPVRLTPVGSGAYVLTPTGPAGDRQLDLFVQPAEGGDTSGAARWTTPGAAVPTSWAHLHQNGPNEGGDGVLTVVVDGAAVDGDVSGTVTVSGSQRTETFELSAYDQGCRGDRYVLLAATGGVDSRVDRLGAGPFSYDVEVVVDGTQHHATATSAAATSATGAEDTPLEFAPALPR